MTEFYRRWMEAWEGRLCFRTNNRVVRPFEWGLEWTANWPLSHVQPRNGHTPEQYLRILNEVTLQDSDAFSALTEAGFALRQP
jgi:hypothetical protein